MVDTRSPEQRSKIMKSVGTAHTGPEITVRRLLHKLGYRFRLQGMNLPGRPDIVLPRFKTAIFVHGCFWHGHRCAKGKPPKSRKDYWLPKLAANRARDRKNLKSLDALGWRHLVVWQCETRDTVALARLLKSNLRRSNRK
jgi:DNA mismatch endonuclease (patch repair protein)